MRAKFDTKLELLRRDIELLRRDMTIRLGGMIAIAIGVGVMIAAMRVFTLHP